MPWEKDKKYGSFKKILIPRDELLTESLDIREKITYFENAYRHKLVSDVDICFHIVLIFLKARLGNRAFLKMGTPLPSEENVLSFLEHVRFFGMPDNVRLALYHWKRGDWCIQLVDYHPTGKEMLYSQSLGIRLVTIDWEACKNGTLVEEKRDALEHLLHDLAHAYMFFREDYDYPGQVDFFKKMYEDWNNFAKYLEIDPNFKKKFEYCISDMNSHPAHLRAYWNAIKREAGIVEV